MPSSESLEMLLTLEVLLKHQWERNPTYKDLSGKDQGGRIDFPPSSPIKLFFKVDD